LNQIDNDSALGCYGVLHWAAHIGHSEMIHFLLANDAMVNLQDAFRGTPIHMAAREGQAAAVQQLIDAKADPDAQDDRDSTALHKASEQGHLEVVKTLLRCPRTQVDLQDADGDTALHLAAHGVNVIKNRHHPQVVEQLVLHGASTFIERKNGRRAFELTKNKEIRALLEPKNIGGRSVTPARRNADLFELPPPPDLAHRKRSRSASKKDAEEREKENTTAHKFSRTEPTALQFTPSRPSQKQEDLPAKKKVLAVKSNSEVDLALFGSCIDNTSMYRLKDTNHILSGGFLRMWLIQKGPQTGAGHNWVKTDLALWEPEQPLRNTNCELTLNL